MSILFNALWPTTTILPVLGKLNFSHVERSDTGDLVVGMDDSRGLSLDLGEHNVYKVH